jgi:hypothetical protein
MIRLLSIVALLAIGIWAALSNRLEFVGAYILGLAAGAIISRDLWSSRPRYIGFSVVVALLTIGAAGLLTGNRFLQDTAMAGLLFPAAVWVFRRTRRQQE